MKPEYKEWLIKQGLADSTVSARLNTIKKVETYYGDLDEHFAKGTYQTIIDTLRYTAEHERDKKPNPSQIKFDGSSANIRTALSQYKTMTVNYLKFLNDNEFQSDVSKVNNDTSIEYQETNEDSKKQRFSLERDMQNALRKNIKDLDPNLTIIDDGAERSVDSGLIDILCEDKDAIVVVELKAGTADRNSIGQILAYMGDIKQEEERAVKGILVAHDFHPKAKSAASMVPNLVLKRYAIKFDFFKDE
jgi:RecB family endonuclease NucS